jgi:hypothetical protein
MKKEDVFFFQKREKNFTVNMVQNKRGKKSSKRQNVRTRGEIIKFVT